VIALATKELKGFDSSKLLNVKREDIENNLVFLGFLIMENKLKPESTEVLQDLQKCEVKCIMATGDNILTAVSVARQCSIIDEANEVWIGDIVDSNSVAMLIWKSSKSNETFKKLPWNYEQDDIEVAVTGKAFRYIVDNR
jgi:cation-transporting ATPase 13A3/4/5